MRWWQQLVAFCVSLSAVLVALGLLAKWGHWMFGIGRKFNRLLDQMLGDPTADPPIPSLMEQLNEIRDEQNRQAAWQVEHSRLHGSNGGASTPAGRRVRRA